MVGLRSFETGLRGFGRRAAEGVQQEGGRGEVNLPQEGSKLRPKGRRIFDRFRDPLGTPLGSLGAPFGHPISLGRGPERENNGLLGGAVGMSVF